jgi:hypothetical protein
MNELLIDLVLQGLALFVKDRALHAKYRQRILAEVRAYNAEVQTSAQVRERERAARKRLKERNRGG